MKGEAKRVRRARVVFKRGVSGVRQAGYCTLQSTPATAVARNCAAWGRPLKYRFEISADYGPQLALKALRRPAAKRNLGRGEHRVAPHSRYALYVPRVPETAEHDGQNLCWNAAGDRHGGIEKRLTVTKFAIRSEPNAAWL